MSGYAARQHPSEGVLANLSAKALALRDPKGNRVVFVSTDLIGLPGDISNAVAERARTRFALERSELLLNSSHTHCGPAVGHNLSVMFDFNAPDAAAVQAYADRLRDNLVEVIGGHCMIWPRPA